MSKTEINELIKKALFLETHERTAFLDQIEESELKQKIALLLNDDTELTQFILKTSHGAQPLSTHQIKDLKAGDKINQFIIIKLIAKGGMGSVYMAYDEKLKRNVAIKTIRSEYIKNKATQNRFKQEAQILSLINHPSICQIYDYIDYDDGDMLVLELVDGTTLNNIDLSIQEKLDVFIQIASALEVAHKKDVIHRDLKPDNIMCTEDKKIKVLDFGIAKSTVMESPISHTEEIKVNSDEKPITKMGTLMGTLLYMSPEQAQGKEVTKASDIYSFGIIMQELLTGVTVYDLGSTKELKKQVMQAEKINTELIPKAYQTLLTSLTNKNPAKRLNAQELKQVLLEIQKEPQLKKRKLRNIIIGFLTISLMFILFYQWYDFSKERDKTIVVTSIKDEIKNISLTWDRIYTLPVHDITQDLSNLETKVGTLVRRIEEAQILNIKEKSLLKGLTLFAYKEYKKSLPLLEASWDENEQNPQLASDLAMANMMTYYQESKMYHYNQAKIDEGFITKINNKYYLPANNYMQSSSLTTQVASIPQALLLWHDKKEEQAIAMLKQLRSEKDWQFEIYQLEGEIMLSLSKKYYNEGKVNKAALMWKEITQVFQQASQRGRSFSKAYEEICIVENMRITYTKKQAYGDVTEIYKNGIENCNNALKIKPTNVKMFDILAFSHGTYANLQLYKGQNPLNLYNKSLDFIDKSISIKKTYKNLSYKARILAGIGQYKNLIGKDPDVEIKQSIKTHIESGKIAKNASFYIHSGLMWAYLLKMERQYIIGENPENSLSEIIQNYDAAKNLPGLTKPELSSINSFIALAYGYFANYQYYTNVELTSSIKKIELYVSKSNSLADYNPFNNSVLADAYSLIIKTKIANKIDAQVELTKALKVIKSVIKSNEEPILNVYAKLLFLQQQNDLIQGRIEQLNLVPVVEVINDSLKVNKIDVKVYKNLAEAYLFQAQHSKDNINYFLDLGINACDTANKINPIYGYTYWIKAKLLLYGIESNVYSKDKQIQVNELFKKASSLNPLLRKL